MITLEKTRRAEWLDARSFAEFERLTTFSTPSEKSEMFGRLPEPQQRACWQQLAAEIRRDK